MWQDALWNYALNEIYELVEWAKCGDSAVSVFPTLLWAGGAAALAHRTLSTLFRHFMFRRVPLWELILQHLLFVWMVVYSLHLWTTLVRILKALVQYCYEDDSDVIVSEDEMEARKVMQQWAVWMCAAAPLAIYIQARPRPQPPPLMIWITTSPWQRREMGPYGYYLNRPPSDLHSTTNASIRDQVLTMRRAFSDTIITKEPPKKKRYSKSI